ncbi:MAG: hypothetical protein ACKOC0_15890 [Cytophagales bacterium]
MNKQFCLIVIFITLTPISLFSQDSVALKRNEIKLNVGYLLGGYPEISYERVLNEESSVGLSTGVNIENSDYKFNFIPYYRVYFGKKPAAGFFMEGNLALFSLKRTEYDYRRGIQTYTNFLGFGAGIGLGGKFITKNGFIAELLGGLGRNFVNTNVINVYPRFGISIGKRF